MKLPIRTIYGLQALLEIALNQGAEGVKSTEIAGARGIPVKFLEQILMSLKREKLVKSLRGRSGGYFLGRSARAIESLGGPLSLTGGGKKEEVVIQILKKVETDLKNELKKITLEDIVKEKIKKEKISVYAI
jgi:DNA-binding IscR family transcriptional regulator